MNDRAIEVLIDEITVDAYGEEGFDAFACHFVDEIGLRCSRDEFVEPLFQAVRQVIPTAGELAKR